MIKKYSYPKVYIASVKPFYDESLFEVAYNKLPLDRKKKIDSYRFKKNKTLSLGAGLLLNYALAQENIDINNINILYTEMGKPYIENSNVHFNLSHSEEYVMCAIAANEIGCDIQEISHIDIKIAKRFFSGNEFQDIASRKSKDEIIATFFRYWTLKESFVKAVGRGLNIPLDSFQINLSDTVSVRQYINDLSYSFKEFNIVDEYKVAICTSTDCKHATAEILNLENIISD